MAQIGHYTLGAYVDPVNPLIRHEAHTIQRLEREARWDLRPAALPRELPLVPAPVVIPEVEPVSEEPVPAVKPAVPHAEVASVTPEPSVAKTPKPRLPELVPALTPNADGLIDLTAVPKDSEVNPFTVRDAGPAVAREVTVHVAGIAGGTSRCAIVNGRTVEPGETVEALAVAQIEADSVLFRFAEQLIRVPVGPKAARIRFPL